MNQPFKSKVSHQIAVIEDGRETTKPDEIVIEEPLEIRLGESLQTVAVTMRSPGQDFDLAAGFLYSEGVINQHLDIAKMNYCNDRQLKPEERYNIINVFLKDGLTVDLKSLQRHFFTNSACGVCGKNSLESLQNQGCSALDSQWSITPSIIYSLPDKLRLAQGVFKATGGLHAAALFNSQGELLKIREDIGRHNALDKLIGSAFLAGELPLENSLVMVSGRSSFEIIQKCIRARIPILCAVSAPSSLAIDLAQGFGITLIGFLRDRRFNLYTHPQRIQLEQQSPLDRVPRVSPYIKRDPLDELNLRG